MGRAEEIGAAVKTVDAKLERIARRCQHAGQHVLASPELPGKLDDYMTRLCDAWKIVRRSMLADKHE